MNKLALALATLALLAGCIVYRDAPLAPAGPAAPESTPVALGQPVWLRAVIATPIEVVEDSRCPALVRCVWAGQLVVRTRIDGAGWRETVDLKLGDPTELRGKSITLISGLPEKRAERETQPGEYRFVYEGGE